MNHQLIINQMKKIMSCKSYQRFKYYHSGRVTLQSNIVIPEIFKLDEVKQSKVLHPSKEILSRNKSPNILNSTKAPIFDDPNDDNYNEDILVVGPAGLERGGPTRNGSRPEPTRYGDWERNGRISDF